MTIIYEIPSTVQISIWKYNKLGNNKSENRWFVRDDLLQTFIEAW